MDIRPNGENQKRQEIFDLQNMLYVVSRFENGVPDIIPDGIEGERTTQAVRNFQARNGLTPNGIVDLTTWNAIVDRYREVLELLEPAVRIGFFPKENDAIFKRGDFHNAIHAAQLLFNLLADEFDEYQRNEISGILDEITENNIRKFQSSHSLEPNGQIDKNTWNRLANYHNLYHL